MSQLTSEAYATGAHVAAGHILARAAVHARVGLALVVVDVAVFAAPAGVAQAFVAAMEDSNGFVIIRPNVEHKYFKK